MLLHLQAILYGDGKGQRVNLHELQAAIDDVHAYIDKIHLSNETGAEWERLIELIHTLDHMQRLHERCEEEEYRADVARGAEELQETKVRLLSEVGVLLKGLENQNWTLAEKETGELVKTIEESYEPYRHMIVERTGRGELDVPQATRLLEARRWMLRVSRHVAQINKHFSRATLAAGSTE